MTDPPKTVTRQCAFCGTAFEALRSDARFCCTKHRVAYQRWRTRLQVLQIRTHHNLVLIQEYLAFPDAHEYTVDVLHGIASAVEEVLPHTKQKGRKK
jgi:predicted nucleic acid-binding Zn ribbon protein